MVRLVVMLWIGGATTILAAAAPPAEIAVTGCECPPLESLDELMRSFVRDNELPGAALAVTRQGQLVYARGFGFADLERQVPVQPDSLFRIASVSKPITAVAVMRLVEEGKLNLDDRAFDLLPHRRGTEQDRWADDRLGEITVRHLLQHRGGWDRGKSIDPMFHSLAIAFRLSKPPPAEPDDVIRFMLDWHLDFEPGQRYEYSNFGYCLLGRLVEQVTGQSYESYVQQTVLQPSGIRTMRLGKTLPQGQALGEVRYYTRNNRKSLGVVGDAMFKRVPQPYGGWYLESMDAHGGWIGSAIDLARFAAALEPASATPMLSATSRDAMFARPPGNAGFGPDGEPKETYYGLGWLIRDVPGATGRNYWHTGSLPGTSALLVTRHDRFCWAVLFNGSETSRGKNPASEIDPLIHQAVEAVPLWPERDLYRD